MATADPQSERTPSEREKEKKSYVPPAGATRELSWRAPDGSEVRYLVTAEWVVLRKREQAVAEIFHTHYRLASPKSKRPITFVFNGGPGAASAYLHVGALGPKRVAFDSTGQVPAPPVSLVDNAESWLAFTDLVFIDPVGTGLSRAIPSDEQPGANANAKEKTDDKDEDADAKEREFYQLNRDLQSLGEFARRFLSKHGLWDVPVYLAGESYGGFRTAKLARRLQEQDGIGLSAIVAISPALEFTLLNRSDYDVLNSVDTFCSMALAAAYHGRSRVFTRGESLEVMRKAVEEFAVRTLAPALVRLGAEGQSESAPIFTRAADFLGVDRDWVVRTHGRLPMARFARELLRDRQRVLGLYDATVSAIDPFPDREPHEAPDPTLAGISRLFTSGINHWLRSVVGLETERIYELLSLEVNNAWKRDEKKHAFDLIEGATDDLRFAMSMNPHMKVLITHGYYDLVTPYFSSERLAEQMRLLPEQRGNLFVRHFEGGHMFYSWESSRRLFRDWVKQSAYG
jgi:carboxypeptidase C (cathepsin A)